MEGCDRWVRLITGDTFVFLLRNRGATPLEAKQWYNGPTRNGSVVKYLGEGFHINHLPAKRLHLIEVAADC